MSPSYDFKDEWEINAPLDMTWKVVSDSAGWQKWWPGLQEATVTNQHPDLVGSSVQLTWHSKAGYKLRHRITIKTIKPCSLIEFSSDGDLSGYGSWRFESKNNKTHMTIDWHVQTTKRWMNIFSMFLRPIFIKNHHALMAQGEIGLNSYLITKGIQAEKYNRLLS